MTPARPNVAAAVWGFAEATVFFIVPDVLLTWIALKDPRNAFHACFWALAGALLGGVLVWYAGSVNPEPVRMLYASIPAISEQMIIDVHDQLESRGLLALFIGPLTGTPYKIYALEAAGAGYGLLEFLLVSIPARFLRFLVVTAVVVVVSQGLRRFVDARGLRIILISGWSIFYSIYFYAMP